MLRISKRVLIVMLLLVFLSSSIVESTRALFLTPGVGPADTFEYDVSAYWSSSDEYASIPTGLVEYNQTETVEVRISSVSGSNISTFTAFYYKNDTQWGDYGLVDVDTGIGYGPFVAIIAGNLNAGEVIHPLVVDNIVVNETVLKAYESGTRETNRILIEYTNATTGITSRFDRLFDKETGILVESHETTTSTNPQTMTSVSWDIKSSNVWVIPEFPSALILPLFMITTIIVIIAYKKKFAGIAKPMIFRWSQR